MQLKHLPRLGTVGLSSFDGIQSFWIRFWVSSLGIPRLSADKDAEMLLWDARLVSNFSLERSCSQEPTNKQNLNLKGYGLVASGASLWTRAHLGTKL